MKSILFDSSVWIDALKGRTTPQADFLRHAISSEFLEVFVTATIVQEVLQGVRSDREFARLEQEFQEFLLLEFDPLEAAIEAARLAVHVIRYQMELCHTDLDFDLIAAQSELQVVRFPA